MKRGIILFVMCPDCNELQEINKEKDIEFTGRCCDTCGYNEVSLATVCNKCGAIIETVLYED